MSVTILAIVFLLLMLVVTYFGYRFISRSGAKRDEPRHEQCTLCRTTLPQARLFERPAGDTRIYRFCDACIRALYQDLMNRN